MAVYTPVLTYTFRDTLGNSDPNKIIKGAYLDGEFNAIHTASLDAASLSGTNAFAGANTYSLPVGINTTSAPPWLTVDGTGVNTGYHGSSVLVHAPSTGTAAGIWTYSSANTIFQGLLIENSLNGTQAWTSLEMVNDTIGHEMYLFHTSTAFTGGVGFTNQSGSPISGIRSIVNPLVFGSGNNAALSIATTGAISTIAPSGSSTSLIVNAAATGQGISLSGVAGTTAGSDVAVARTSSTANTIGTGPNIQLQDSSVVSATQWQHSGGQSELWQFGSSAWNQILKVLTTRGVVINTPASGSALTVSGVDITPVSGTFTGTLVGCTTSPTATFNYFKIGPLISITIAGASDLTGTSNANNLQVTGVPAILNTANGSDVVSSHIIDNGTGHKMGEVAINSSITGTLFFSIMAPATGIVSTTGFTTSGTKGINAGFNVTILLK